MSLPKRLASVSKLPVGRRGLFGMATSNKKDELTHDYTVTPTTYVYRLDGEVEDAVDSELETIGDKIYNSTGFDSLKPADLQKQFNRYPLTSFEKLYKRSQLSRSTSMQRPKSVKMLTGDFIEDSLYNSAYGYFSKQVEIYHPSKPFNYKNLLDQDEFLEAWLKSYDKYDGEHVKGKDEDKPSFQLWHTPTELFHPYYGQLLARYLLVNYMLNQYPYKDLLIYELGGGNGTLMCDILDYIEREQPEVYSRTRYNIVEISSKLSMEQKRSKSARHADKVKIINKSIFDFEDTVSDPCFFIALEVFDNFSHDVVRYDIDTNRPYQGYVVSDESGDFKEFFSPKLDEWTELFLALREQGSYPIFKMNKLQKLYSDHPLHRNFYWNKLKCLLNPLRSNLTDPEYVPTRLLKFFQILKYRFPEHQLLASDFSYLPDSTAGYNSPVVQTTLHNRSITMNTYMVQQGYFDIMFPTNFALASDLYRQVVGSLSKVSTHKDFLEQWADVDATTTKRGENPMLDFYKNTAFLLS